MEDVLDVYELPYNPELPVVCMDEKPYQCLSETREPLPMREGDDQKIDSEYVREGTCSIFVFTEPLRGWRRCSVRKTRTAADWAEEIKCLLTVCYPDSEKIILVMDNLNTHAISSSYKKYSAQEARSYVKRLEIMKSQLDARPVFLQKEDTITGHFLICYLSVLLVRIFQIKILENKYCTEEIFDFMKHFKVAKLSEKKYINLTKNTSFIKAFSAFTNLPLTSYFLTESQLKNMLSYRF